MTLQFSLAPRFRPGRAVCIALAAALFIGGCGEGSDQGMAGFETQPVPVIAYEVRLDEFVERIEAIGTLKANESVTLTAQVRETVTRVNFDDGQLVEKGDILLEFTSEEESALLAEARANLSEAQKQLARVEDLVTRGNATRSRLDQQTRLAKAARARVDAIAARLEDRLLRAPFAGVLGFRMVSAGTLVEPGSPVATLDDIGRIKLDFSIPETSLSLVNTGMNIKARVAAYPDRVFTGAVRTVDSRVDPVSRAVAVRAILPNDELLLKPGMLATVELVKSRDNVVMVPEEALVPRQRKQFVFVIRSDGTVEEREITIGGRRPGAVVAESGLDVGEQIVVEGTIKVSPGRQVTILSKRSLAGPLNTGG